jgi:glucokinase
MRISGDQAVVAIDLGGTKLATAVVGGRGPIYASRRAPVAKASPEATVEQIVAEAGACVETAGFSWERIAAVGVIVPGIYDASRATAWAPNLWGDKDVPLLAALAGCLPVPVRIDSDRAGYVLGEQWLGAAQGLSDVVFLAVGTGIGAGILSGGRLIRGAGDIAGAVGWFALNPQSRDISRTVGCWEAEAAGPAVARKGGRESAQQVAEAARRGDPAAVAIMEETACYLAMGIANLISVLNPQMVVLGGGLMQAADLLLEPIRRAVPLWAQPRSAAQARIELTRLGDQSGVLGAARLALDKEFAAP